MAMNLDNPEEYLRLDTQNMRRLLREFPEQCQRGWDETLKSPLPPDYRAFDKVIIAGMGGSGISGDLVGDAVSGEIAVPIFNCRDYNLPGFVDEKTLVVVSSYSGNTEESLSAFGEAIKSKAKVLAITSGGNLKQIAGQNGVPIVNISYQAPPRAGMGYALMALLAVFQKVDIISDKTQQVAGLVPFMKNIISRVNEEVLQEQNPAKKLAVMLQNRLPVVYGAGILSGAARRWKTQFNENSKNWAFREIFPELNHNSIVGYDFPGEIKDRIAVIFLRSSLLHPRILRRYELTAQLLKGRGIAHDVIESSGSNVLEHIMSAVIMGDYVSYYLALLNDTDPTPVKTIDWLKKQLG